MRSPNPGGPPRHPEHRAGASLDGFRGVVAVAADHWATTLPGLGTSSWNGVLLAIELHYAADDGPGLLIRTIRSGQPTETAGPNTEDLATVVSNFVLNHIEMPLDPAWLDAAIERGQRIMAEVADAAPDEMTIVVDDHPITGRRVDVAGCAALQLAHGDQTMFCVGTAAALDTLRLRTVLPPDLLHR